MPNGQCIIGLVLCYLSNICEFQGTWMGLLSAAGSLSRAIGPFVVGWLYTDYGTYWTIGWSFIFSGISLAILLFTYKRLIPYQYRNRQPNDDVLELEVTKL